MLYQAARVSVGKLGILVRLTLRIVREQPVTRILRSDIPASQFLASLKEAQDYYKANGTLPAWCDETEWFWIVQRNTVRMHAHTSDRKKKKYILRSVLVCRHQCACGAT